MNEQPSHNGEVAVQTLLPLPPPALKLEPSLGEQQGGAWEPTLWYSAKQMDAHARATARLVAEECAKVIDAEIRQLIDEGAARKVAPWEAVAANIRAKFK